jgi:hypothetical protein
MRRDARLFLLLLAAALGGCASTQAHRPTAIVELPPPSDKQWQRLIVAEDADRLGTFATLWSAALAAAKPRFASALAREGALLDPGRALAHPALPPGSYRCRVVKLGGEGRRVPAYRTFPATFCYVGGESEGQSFTKQTGTERPSGWLYPDDGNRFVFLGAYGLGEAKAPIYGAVPAQSALGVVERIGPFRWRLTLAPVDKSALLTVYEVIPVPAEFQLAEGK